LHTNISSLWNYPSGDIEWDLKVGHVTYATPLLSSNFAFLNSADGSRSAHQISSL